MSHLIKDDRFPLDDLDQPARADGFLMCMIYLARVYGREAYNLHLSIAQVSWVGYAVCTIQLLRNISFTAGWDVDDL